MKNQFQKNIKNYFMQLKIKFYPHFLFFIFIKMVENGGNRIRIYKYKDTNLHNIYYDLVKDEFYVKRSEKTNYFIPIRWKHVFQNYRNKKDYADKQKTYNYIHFYNPETKQSKKITESEWLNDKEEVIKNNIKEEEQMKHILDEIWKHILEFIC
jgi:dipeptidase